VVPEHQAVPLPATVSPELGASLGVPAPALQGCVATITAALGDGALSELPVHRFTLDDIVAVESGVTGKVLIDIG
jgi:hypothetical protein